MFKDNYVINKICYGYSYKNNYNIKRRIIMLNQSIEFTPFIEFLFLIFILILMVYLYNKTEGYWLMLFTLVFSSIITTISITNNVLPFTPYIQTFFIVFQLIIVIFKLFNLE